MTPDMSSMDWRGRIAVLEAERDALRAEVERLKAQAMAAPVSPQAWWELSDKLKKAEAALRDLVRGAEITFADERIGYEEIQVDRGALARARAFLAPEEKP